MIGQELAHRRAYPLQRSLCAHIKPYMSWYVHKFVSTRNLAFTPPPISLFTMPTVTQTMCVVELVISLVTRHHAIFDEDALNVTLLFRGQEGRLCGRLWHDEEQAYST